MNARETAKAAAEERAYQRSAQAVRDRLADRERRELADAKNGHVPACGLNRCAPGCTRPK